MYTKKKKSGKTGLIVTAVLLTILLILMLLLVWGLNNTEQTPSDESVSATDMLEPSATESAIQQTESESAQQPTVPESTVQPTTPPEDQMGKNLGKGLVLLDVNKYTGIYMEDGTDEIVSDVLMLIVSNEGEQDIQYAELTVPTSKGEAVFSLTTLPVGEKVVLLEQNRMLWSADEDYLDVNVKNLAVFSEPLSLCESQLKFQNLDGVINITNISGKDINGDITVYYKNAATDLLYGGITYRIRLEGGLKADEIRQIMASHFSKSGSRIMFATVE